MRKTLKQLTFLLLACAVGFTACNNAADSKKKIENSQDPIEDIATLLKTDVYDDTINGVHVIFKYMGDDDKYFFGSRMNLTDETIEGFQIGVHLSNGMDLGPTPVGDLLPGQEGSMMIDAEVAEWEKWAANVEFVKAEL